MDEGKKSTSAGSIEDYELSAGYGYLLAVSFMTYTILVFQGKFHMESQALKTRYCDKAVLSALLTELFGMNFSVEVYKI